MIAIASWLAPAPGQAQNFAAEGFAIAGGGGTSTGGTFSVSGSLGQPEAAGLVLAGGAFAVRTGFWSLFAIQTPGAPLLTISNRPQLATVTVSWPSPATGFVLQQTDNLANPNWVTITTTVNDSGTTRSINVSPAGGHRFFRLFKP